MKERPILFSTAMVQAILAGRKTMTRRVVKPEIDTKNWKPSAIDKPKEWRPTPWLGPAHRGNNDREWGLYNCSDAIGDLPYTGRVSPYGRPGDLLWVRESWCPWLNDEGPEGYTRLIKFFADDECVRIPENKTEWWEERSILGYHTRPSIHLPKWASRIWLKVTGLRVERLQDIGEEDAREEGIRCSDCDGSGTNEHNCGAIGLFSHLWDSINAARGYGWEKNPWVWVVEFERVDRPQAAKEG